MIIALNFSICKYNSDTWCRNSTNYRLAEMYLRNETLQGFYSGTAHYVFTFLNIGIYAASLICVFSLSNVYRSRGSAFAEN